MPIISPIIPFRGFRFGLRAGTVRSPKDAKGKPFMENLRDVAISSATSTIDGLVLERAHAMEPDSEGRSLRRSLMSELLEATLLEFYVDDRARCGDALHLVFEVGSPMDLPLKLSASTDEVAEDRVLFREARLIHRGLAPWPFG
jgi:hypothetical protein